MKSGDFIAVDLSQDEISVHRAPGHTTQEDTPHGFVAYIALDGPTPCGIAADRLSVPTRFNGMEKAAWTRWPGCPICYPNREERP